MSDLFAEVRDDNRRRARPLAARMRPRTIDEFIGQELFLGPGKLLRRMILADRISSLIFHGPPGCGKTALAHVIAGHARGRFESLNAVTAGIKDVRELLESARRHLELHAERTILFVDEIHRFNRAQQDVLLPDVEDGVVILIGATTENPFHSVNRPLLSRSQLFTFEPISKQSLKTLIRRAIADTERGLGELDVTIDDDALEFLAESADGDARKALTALEIAVRSCADPEVRITLEAAQDSIQRKVIAFDPTGDLHYDLASALIKSMRGSDADAAIYWLARMLEGGEDPRFIARRLVIAASEDVGNADPQALSVATAAWQAVEAVGLPECQLALSQAVLYLAMAPKSNSATTAIGAARKDVRDGTVLPVPKHLRDSHYRGADQLGHGVGYQYSHDSADGIADQDYLGVDRRYYHPADRGAEAELIARLEAIRRRLRPQGSSE